MWENSGTHFLVCSSNGSRQATDQVKHGLGQFCNIYCKFEVQMCLIITRNIPVEHVFRVSMREDCCAHSLVFNYTQHPCRTSVPGIHVRRLRCTFPACCTSTASCGSCNNSRSQLGSSLYRDPPDKYFGLNYIFYVYVAQKYKIKVCSLVDTG